MVFLFVDYTYAISISQICDQISSISISFGLTTPHWIKQIVNLTIKIDNNKIRSNANEVITLWTYFGRMKST